MLLSLFLACLRPNDWCNSPGDTFQYIDCDNDGVLDATCSEASGILTIRKRNHNNNCYDMRGHDACLYSISKTSKYSGCSIIRTFRGNGKRLYRAFVVRVYQVKGNRLQFDVSRVRITGNSYYRASTVLSGSDIFCSNIILTRCSLAKFIYII